MKVELNLGRTVVTASVAGLMNRDEITQEAVYAMFERHRTGDWGQCDPEEARENDRSVGSGDRVHSVYVVDGTKRSYVFWVITDPVPDFDKPTERLSTTVLLPEDY